MNGQALLCAVLALALLSMVAKDARGDDAAIVDASKQGAFTREQAARGREQYLARCSVCHMEDLAGGSGVPQLAGDVFLSRWSTQTVGDLYLRIRLTMPQNAPGTLKEAMYRDIVAFILRANNYPAGNFELPTDVAVLGKTLMSAAAR